MTTTPMMIARSALSVACAAGSVLLLSSTALAHGAHAVASTDRAAAMDPAHHAAMAGPADGEGYRRSARSYSAIPDVVLTDSEARPVRLRELLAAADPVMVNFIFTTCTTICPVMTKVFADVRSRLGDEAKHVRMISISIDPENDTPAQLKAYAQKFEADARWTFLTGRVQDVAAVQRAFDAYNSDKMSHEPLTLLRAVPGNAWVRIDGFASPEELAGEYRSAVAR